jgi:hypothetical protein
MFIHATDGWYGGIEISKGYCLKFAIKLPLLDKKFCLVLNNCLWSKPTANA